jgi:DNA helicase-2/ATP-dependent DNA helicase PcrA
VLFRIGYLSDSLEIELSRRKIPYHKYGGLRFLEAAHVKDLIALLRIAENPRDEMAWFRILQLFDGIGPSSAASAIRHVAANRDDARSIRTFKAPRAAAAQVKALADLLDDLLATERRPPASDVERIRRFYDPILKKNYPNAKVRLRDIESLEQIAAGYRSRRSFLTDLQLDPPSSTSDLAGTPTKDEDWLTLSTIHSAKGCEWDVVFLIHAADGCLPSDLATGDADEIEEERRLAYVAMTRPRDFLYVCWPLRYYHKMRGFTDRHTYAQPSRFLTKAVQKSMEKVTLDQEAAEDAAAGISGSRDIGARLRARWE